MGYAGRIASFEIPTLVSVPCTHRLQWTFTGKIRKPFYDAFIDVFSKYGGNSGGDDTTFSVTDCGAELDDAFKLIPKTSYEILMEHFKVCRPI